MNPGAYVERHAQTLVGALGRLWQRPFATALTLGVLGITLALPLLLQLFILNAQPLIGDWASSVQMSAYLAPGIDDPAAQALRDRIRSRPEVAGVQLITATQGLAQFREQSGLGAVLDELGSNPLPAVLVISPAAAASSPPALEALRASLAALPGIEQVEMDAAWALRLQSWLRLFDRLLLATATVLGVAVLLVVGSTIRLEVAARREEIEVMKLVGGSNAFARRPFLYSGLLYGLGGGLIALGLACGLLWLLDAPVRELSATYGSGRGLMGMPWKSALGVVGGAAALGWLGAWVAATAHIRRIDPT